MDTNMAGKPLKMMVAATFLDGAARNAETVHQLVAGSYPSERYCSRATIAEHLKSLKAVGVLQEDGSYLDDTGALVSVYRISEYGVEKLRKAQ
ncbi:MAG: hypothetical protein AUJ49_00490 [Desulfovibrionaceae bacterium CG1_02_65_16]|nr:MAG: hypothetical protein AUJ49_00490 [Desulfovibrionaceae bacterium CG1_02_65_16]